MLMALHSSKKVPIFANQQDQPNKWVNYSIGWRWRATAGSATAAPWYQKTLIAVDECHTPVLHLMIHSVETVLVDNRKFTRSSDQ